MSATAAGLPILVALVGGIIFVTARIARAEGSKVAGRIRGALERVRLSRMLRKRAIDGERYVQETDPIELRAQIARCATCANVEQCDEVLADEGKGQRDYAFCPNDPAIGQSQAQAEAELSRRAP